MSEEVKETASTATNDKIATKDPNQPTDFSLDNLKLQFEECLNDDNTISIEKYIFGMSTYFLINMLALHVTNFLLYIVQDLFEFSALKFQTLGSIAQTRKDLVI